jgi:hypothetical protein
VVESKVCDVVAPFGIADCASAKAFVYPRSVCSALPEACVAECPFITSAVPAIGVTVEGAAKFVLDVVVALVPAPFALVPVTAVPVTS